MNRQIKRPFVIKESLEILKDLGDRCEVLFKVVGETDYRFNGKYHVWYSYSLGRVIRKYDDVSPHPGVTNATNNSLSVWMRMYREGKLNE